MDDLKERQAAVALARAAAQEAAEKLRNRRDELSALDTAQALSGDVELDMLARQYQRAIADLDNATYALGEDA